ncbi:MAG TPA: adenosylcobinamide-GDP ribazoletransferase [Blastocatellia bacterium]|nr:adenosylcobinamide-GDP ribazoletransferase [Blastocatellia bacterium]
MIRLFLIAVQFLTRLPVPKSLIASEQEIGKATMFFPAVGVIVGGIGSFVYLGMSNHFPASTSVIGVIIVCALVTGGFHEDGLADSFDGFGGGWKKEDILRIMRDSRIGTFGGLALILLILAKYNFLSIIGGPHLWRWLVVAHTASRWTVLPLCIWLPYARAEGQGGLVARRVGWTAASVATGTLILVLLLLPLSNFVTAFAVVVGVTLLSGLYYRHRLGGITGDCLGATNQIAEVAIYAVAVVLSKHGLAV